jgi:hypothetical protein
LRAVQREALRQAEHLFATRLMIAPAARMLVRRFAGPEAPDSAPPEVKRAWELQYKRVINEIRASIGD